jgi:hypothetical protein
VTLAIPRKIFKTSNLSPKYSRIRTYWVIFPVWLQHCFSSCPCKILIPGGLSDAERRHTSQNIVKEGLTRKIFRNKDLAGRVSDWARCRSRMILRCKCARFHCALLVARVKVGCHEEYDFGCGKATSRGAVAGPPFASLDVGSCSGLRLHRSECSPTLSPQNARRQRVGQPGFPKADAMPQVRWLWLCKSARRQKRQP